MGSSESDGFSTSRESEANGSSGGVSGPYPELDGATLSPLAQDSVVVTYRFGTLSSSTSSGSRRSTATARASSA